MAEQPTPEHPSAMSAGVEQVRAAFTKAGLTVRRLSDRLRGTKRSEVVEKPAAGSVSADAEPDRVRPEKVDATASRRRTFEHWRLALVIIGVVVQGLLAWAGWRLRERRRLRREWPLEP
jgi:hypothetical protein